MSTIAEKIGSKKVIDGVEVAAGGSYTTEAIDVSELAPEQKFSLHFTLSGSGTGKFEYVLKNLATGNYITPASASNIKAAVGAGEDIVDFSPELATSLKIKVSETGGADPITVTGYLVIQ